MRTSYFNIPSPQGYIWCAYDQAEDRSQEAPLVIIAPGYEKTSRNNIALALYLVLNGFNVLRFDASNCTGLSSGDIENFTLSSFTQDIETVIDYASDYLAGSHLISVISLSLSSRCLVKYLAGNPGAHNKILAFLSIVGVCDVEYTASQILGANHYPETFAGRRFGVRKFMTYDVNWDNFFLDAKDFGYLSFDTAIADAQKVNIPYFISIMTDHDEWNLAWQQKVFFIHLQCAHKEQTVIEGASHQIWKNPRSAEIALQYCVKYLKNLYPHPSLEIIRPDMTDIIEINRRERRVIMESTLTKSHKSLEVTA
ncbi:hypothetical protein [Syntrophomonas palmitatica]|uniref:hypothetical protein n=1 Tax=Syntrophomonas palmitatica TaxID=402877 RepID=UPI0006D27BAB|nr:hypothetical protein [Syntrophomonas palmitatica]